MLHPMPRHETGKPKPRDSRNPCKKVSEAICAHFAVSLTAPAYELREAATEGVDHWETAEPGTVCSRILEVDSAVCRTRGTYKPINFAVILWFSCTLKLAGVSSHLARNRLARIPQFFCVFAHPPIGWSVPPPGPKSPCANSTVFVSSAQPPCSRPAAAPQPPRSRPAAAPQPPQPPQPPHTPCSHPAALPQFHSDQFSSRSQTPGRLLGWRSPHAVPVG